MMRWIVLFALIIFATSGCYDNHNTYRPEQAEAVANCTISQLKQRCGEGCTNIVADLVCAGRVTTSDSEGNFYRSFVIEDSTGGLEILLGTYNIASRYPAGTLVTIKLNGTAIMVENGVLQVGLPPYTFDSTPREFESQAVIDSHIIRGASVEDVKPTLCDITSLSPELCGRKIKIEGIYHSPLEDYEERDYHRFENDEGDAVFAYISPYADFSDIAIPTTELSIQGILYYETVGMSIGKQFVIRPISRDDISTTDHNF